MHLAGSILVVWNYTVTHFGDPSVFMRSTWCKYWTIIIYVRAHVISYSIHSGYGFLRRLRCSPNFFGLTVPTILVWVCARSTQRDFNWHILGSHFASSATFFCTEVGGQCHKSYKHFLTLAHRVWILTKRIWFAALIAMCSVLIILCFIGITITNLAVEEFTYRYPTGTKVMSTVGLSVHILVDAMITGNLVWYLRTHRSGLSRSDAVITDIIRCRYLWTLWNLVPEHLTLHIPVTMQTGIVTMVVVTVVFILVEIDSVRCLVPWFHEALFTFVSVSVRW